DPNFEEILSKHLAETYNYYQVRATRNIAQSQVDEVRRQRDEYFRQQNAQSPASNLQYPLPTPQSPMSVKSPERVPSNRQYSHPTSPQSPIPERVPSGISQSSGLHQPGYGIDFPSQPAHYNP